MFTSPLINSLSCSISCSHWHFLINITLVYYCNDLQLTALVYFWHHKLLLSLCQFFFAKMVNHLGRSHHVSALWLIWLLIYSNWEIAVCKLQIKVGPNWKQSWHLLYQLFRDDSVWTCDPEQLCPKRTIRCKTAGSSWRSIMTSK